jgi:hypothetical protein
LGAGEKSRDNVGSVGGEGDVIVGVSIGDVVVGVSVGDDLVVVGEADGDWEDPEPEDVGVGSAARAAGALPPTRTIPVPRPMISGFRTDRASTAYNLPNASPVMLHPGLPHGSGKNHAIT